jgi:hypothetical protein
MRLCCRSSSRSLPWASLECRCAPHPYRSDAVCRAQNDPTHACLQRNHSANETLDSCAQLLLLVSSLLPTTDDILESMTQGKDVDAKRASHAELKMGSQMRSSVPTSAGVPTAVLDRLVLQEAQDRIELERSAFVAKEGVKRLVERCPHLKANLGELSNLVDTIISPHESSSDCARPTL